MIKFFSYFYMLIKANLKSHITDKKKFISMSSIMFFQNFLFFFLWVVFFNNVSDIKGWVLSDIARLFGLMACSFGIANMLFAGIRSLPFLLQDNSFDAYISKPVHPLPALLCCVSGPSALGDILFAPVIFFIWGDITLQMLPMLLFMIIASSILLLSATIMVYSISLWVKSSARFHDQLYEMMLIFSMNVIHGQPILLKAIAFTIIPAGFISYLPIRLLNNFNWYELFILLIAIIVYAFISLAFFNGGVKRYKKMI